MSGASQTDEVFGKDLGVVHEAVVTGRKIGADQRFWSAIAHNQELFKQIISIVDLFNEKVETEKYESEITARERVECKVDGVYDIVVDCSRSLVEMIEAGKYESFNNNITAEHFPVRGQGKQEKIITLFYFNRTMSRYEVRHEIEKRGFRPAEIQDLLGLGEKYPDLQKKFSIAAFGSVLEFSDGNFCYMFVPCLEPMRVLGLFPLKAAWNARWRFAVVPK